MTPQPRPRATSILKEARDDDTGASLILALILITVVALVLGSILAFSGTSVRTTIALRDQATAQYTAAGAAQVTINKIRRTGDPTSICPTAGNGKLNFHALGRGNGNVSQVSASVLCASDPNTGGGGNPTGANTSPASALLTLAPQDSGETGIDINLKMGQTLKVNGGIFSNSTISVDKGTLENVWPYFPSDPDIPSYTVARGGCDGNVVTDAPPPGVPAGQENCQTGVAADDWRGTDPGLLVPHGASYDMPTLPTVDATYSDCGKGKKAPYQTVSPGKLTADILSQISGCKDGVVWFQPGTYYFDDAGPWNIGDKFVLAGTPTDMSLLSSGRLDMKDEQDVETALASCVSPDAANATINSGVEFVFGGSSTLAVNASGGSGSQLVVCASASASGPPVAIYSPRSGETAVTQSACLTQVVDRCALIDTSGNCPKCLLTIDGTTYTPNNWLDMGLNNAALNVFRWGLITRSISLTTTGSSLGIDGVFIDVPGTARSPEPPQPSDMLLQVYTCSGSKDCDVVIGNPHLVVKFRLSASKPHSVTILSWAERR